MNKPKPRSKTDNLTDVARAAIGSCGLSLYDLAEQTIAEPV
jgi:hypothetical protein